MKNNQTLKIYISGYVQPDPSYVVYVLNVETDIPEYDETKSVVQRRYSEFEWLRRRLAQLHPGCFIPPLPGKNMISSLDPFSDDFLKPRLAGLQKFITRISQHPILPWASDFMHFLQYSREQFVNHMNKNPVPNGFMEMFMDLSVKHLPSNTVNHFADVGSKQTNPALNTDSGVGVPVQTAGGQKFAHQLYETDEFIEFTQRLKRATEHIIHGLKELSGSYEELSHCLHSWSSNPIYLSGQKANTSPIYPDGDCGGGNAGGDVADDSAQIVNLPKLISRGARTVSTVTHNLADQLNEHVLPDWNELNNYAKSIRTVLESRDGLQRRYNDLFGQIKTRSAESNLDNSYGANIFSTAKAFLPWRQKPVTELLGSLNSLHDQLTIRNEQIHGDFIHWQYQRHNEVQYYLTQMYNLHFSQWNSITSNWNSLSDNKYLLCPNTTDQSEQLPNETTVPANNNVPDNDTDQIKEVGHCDNDGDGLSDSMIAKLDC